MSISGHPFLFLLKYSYKLQSFFIKNRSLTLLGMEQEYTKDYFWEIYKQLPEELKDALFSDNNNDLVTNICTQAKLDEDQTSIVAKYVGRVIMGLLPIDEFPITIELELNISQDLANQIHRQIYISIFKHLRIALNKINDRNSGYTDVFTSSKDGLVEKEPPKKPVASTFPQPNTFPQPKPAPLPAMKKEVFTPPPKPSPITPPEKEIPPQKAILEKPIPENPLFENKPVNPPQIPSRDAFKNSLENINLEKIKTTKLSDLPAIEDSAPDAPASTPKNNDPYKEAPL